MNNNKSIELQEAITTYISWKKRYIDSAETRYLPALKGLSANLGEISLNEITGDSIVRYDELLETLGYSGTTRALALRIIRNFIMFWHGRGEIEFSPKEIVPPQLDTAQQVVVDKDDMDKISFVLDENDVFDLQKLTAIYLLWDTGVRISELLNLRISDLNVSSEGARVAKVVSRKKKGEEKYDLITWSEETDKLLQKLIAYLLAEEGEPDYIFRSLKGNQSRKKLSPRTLQRWMRELCEQAMIGKRITPHSFRHGKGHDILNKGGDIIDVQKILRHKNINSSLHYTRLNQSKYLQRASRFIDTGSTVKVPIDFVESETEILIPKVVLKSKAVYNSI